LELAAKANGLSVDKYSDCGNYIYTHTVGKWWSSLMDAGDALRVAVELQMQILIYANCVLIDSDYGLFEEDFIDQMPCAATRRAITRAAAAIGEQMQQGKA
jgi:hypothetical protein